MKWYKYLPAKYADAMLSNGSIRLGSLNGYRDIEWLGKAIGDDAENTLIVQGNMNLAISFSNDGSRFIEHIYEKWKEDPSKPPSDNTEEALYLLFQMGSRLKDGQLIGPKTFSAFTEESEEVYVYCVSAEFNEATMNRMSAESEAVGRDKIDACVEISSSVRFGKLLSRRMAKQGFRFVDHGRCQYIGRAQFFDKPRELPAWLRKPKEYDYQKEWRLVYRPVEKYRDNFVDINAPEIIRLCQRIV